MEGSCGTERLILRRFTPADAGRLVELDSDAEVMRFLTGGKATPRELIEEDILPRFTRVDPRHPAAGFWAVHERATGAFVGWVGLTVRAGAQGPEAELGYRIRRVSWGRGYATEASRALVDRIFAEPGVTRVVATTFEANLASRRVMEKLGMRLVRRFRLSRARLAAAWTFDGAGAEPWDGDDVEYEVRRERWRLREAGQASGG